MKKLSVSLIAFLVPAVVCAADLPKVAKSTPATPVAASTWTGVYVGAFGGFANGSAHIEPDAFLTDIGAYPVKMNLNGGFVGGAIGYNYEMNNGLVLGAVGDLAWARIKGATCVEATVGYCNGSYNDSYAHGTVNWLSTLRGKLGFAPSNDLLLYATGGLAIAGARGEDTYVDGANNMTAHTTQAGWTVGAGADYKLSSSVSLEAEYLYADLGKKDYRYSIASASQLFGEDLRTRSDLKLNLFKVGLNYHF